MARRPTPIERIAVVVADPTVDPRKVRDALQAYADDVTADGYKVEFHVPVTDDLFDTFESAFEADESHALTELIFTAQDAHLATEIVCENKSVVNAFADYEFPFGRGKGLRPLPEVRTFTIRPRARSKTPVETVLAELLDTNDERDVASVLLFGDDAKLVKTATKAHINVFDGDNGRTLLNADPSEISSPEVVGADEIDVTEAEAIEVDIVRTIADEVTLRITPVLENITAVLAELVHEYQQQRVLNPSERRAVRRRR